MTSHPPRRLPSCRRVSGSCRRKKRQPLGRASPMSPEPLPAKYGRARLRNRSGGARSKQIAQSHGISGGAQARKASLCIPAQQAGAASEQPRPCYVVSGRSSRSALSDPIAARRRLCTSPNSNGDPCGAGSTFIMRMPSFASKQRPHAARLVAQHLSCASCRIFTCDGFIPEILSSLRVHWHSVHLRLRSHVAGH